MEAVEAPDGRASLVAAAGGRVIGHVNVHMEPYKVAGLGMMVDARWRGQGVGGALVEGAIARARALGAHKLALQLWPHNDAARRLYRRHGFVDEGLLRRHYRRRNGELWDAVIMGLVLDVTSPGSSASA
jgi:RimJ/RimL family protein N-acetyltransferase